MRQKIIIIPKPYRIVFGFGLALCRGGDGGWLTMAGWVCVCARVNRRHYMILTCN